MRRLLLCLLLLSAAILPAVEVIQLLQRIALVGRDAAPTSRRARS